MRPWNWIKHSAVLGVVLTSATALATDTQSSDPSGSGIRIIERADSQGIAPFGVLPVDVTRAYLEGAALRELGFSQLRRMPHSSMVSREVAPPPVTRRYLGSRAGLPLLRWRTVEIDLVRAARLAGQYPEGAVVELFPGVEFELDNRRFGSGDLTVDWMGAADGDPAQPVYAVWSAGRAFASARLTNGGEPRSYEAILLRDNIFLIMEFAGIEPVQCETHTTDAPPALDSDLPELDVDSPTPDVDSPTLDLNFSPLP